jgi:putative transposase of IS4/5 family DUF4096
MARTKRTVKPLPTIWNCPDDLWDMIQPVLQELDPPHKGHRQRIEPRPALDGIIYQMRSGCQWNQLPYNLAMIPPFIARCNDGSNAAFSIASRVC